MLDLGKPTPPLVGRQADEKSTLPYLPTSCMTFHEMENGFAPTLGCRFGYCTYAAHAVVGRAGQARRAARCSNSCGAFPRGFSIFFSLFFFSNRELGPRLA